VQEIRVAQRTWNEKEVAQSLKATAIRAKKTVEGEGESSWTPGVKAFEKIVIGPCTLGRTLIG
jgi:hypothetical protein